MAQSASQWIPVIGIGAIAMIALSKKKASSKKKKKKNALIEEDHVSVCGITITEDEILLTDWTDWMYRPF